MIPVGRAEPGEQDAELKNETSASMGIGTDSYAAPWTQHVLGDGIAARLNLMKHASDIAGDAANVSRWGIAPSIAFGLNAPAQRSPAYHMQSDDLPDGWLPTTTVLAARTWPGTVMARGADPQQPLRPGRP